MPFTFKGTVTKVGNSNMLVLPKPLCDAFGIERGDSLSLLVTEKGIYIPVIAKKDSEAKRAERIIAEIEKEAK
ncbi:MAG: AbrB/MazE/SpoVT family DNA-binding domain-containing protein [Nitrososphaerota archaeon]|nr:AbrB/MazE/SpoVT family DNA-binding domain-containing protein [Nitrososphaerota archaeon]MDG6923636.1 AbrB/MazE/SpoVT family DNA-binding domain-containing protein [Nitrososphaerota archaeon]